MKNIVLTDRVAFMQRILDCASKGYVDYCGGLLKNGGWANFQRKMTLKHNLEISDSSRSKRRKAGEAMARLYGLQLPKNESVLWLLLVSSGEGPSRNKEDLVNLRLSRIVVDDYELVHDGVRWSWKMTRVAKDGWNNRFEKVAKYPPERRRIGIGPKGKPCDIDAEVLLDELYAVPGFRLIRRQVGEIVSQARKSWKRYRPAKGPELNARKYLSIVRRVRNHPKPTPPNEVALNL